MPSRIPLPNCAEGPLKAAEMPTTISPPAPLDGTAMARRARAIAAAAVTLHRNRRAVDFPALLRLRSVTCRGAGTTRDTASDGPADVQIRNARYLPMSVKHRNCDHQESAQQAGPEEELGEKVLP